MRYAGIDLGDKSSAICVLTGEGEVVTRQLIRTEEGALREALSGHGESMTVVVEACPQAEWVSRIVESQGCRVDIVDARAAKQVMDARKKTDKRDAETLAQLAYTGWYQPVHRKSGQARLQRSQIQARQGAVRTYKAMASQVRGLLRAHGFRVPQVSKDRFSDQVRQLAGQHVPELLPFLEPLLELYDLSVERARQMKRRIEQTSHSSELHRRLASVPGVGELTSQVYVATIDRPDRFQCGDQVGDYVGLSPGIKQSGESCKRGSITREGDHLLRWHLVEASHNLLVRGRDCRLKRWGQDLERRKGAAKARVAVARKLAVILWRLWLTGETFDGQRGAVAR